MSGPHVSLNPDPLQVRPAEWYAGFDSYAEGFGHGWDARGESLSVDGLAHLFLAALSGALVGAALMWMVR